MTITFSQLGNQGRLGNQLFQMTAAICLALSNNDNYQFPSWKYEPYFNLHNCFSNNFAYTSTYNEPHFHYTHIPYQPNLNLSGYFQSYKYMIGHEDFIKNKFIPINKIEAMPNTTSIHVRRGDYVLQQQFHPIMTMDYYKKAIDICNTEKYYIFSDDIVWCKSKFVGSQFIFADGNHETIDMAMMSKCQNIIMANSSFSWWAGWLGEKEDKKIIYPKQWFGPALLHDTKDLIPQKENWIGL